MLAKKTKNGELCLYRRPNASVLSTPSQGQAHRKLLPGNHPQNWVGMAEPIRRWLRLALGSKPGSPRGREPGGGVEHGGGQIVSPCARSFNSLQTLPWMLQSNLSKILLALCLSVQVKGRKHGVAGTKCKHYGCRSVTGFWTWRCPAAPAKERRVIFKGRQVIRLSVRTTTNT
ncbi:hypothetical protein V8C44DRAFT_59695 [Trichoderma aethiopicum]